MVLFICTKKNQIWPIGAEYGSGQTKSEEGLNGQTDGRSQNYIPSTSSRNNNQKEGFISVLNVKEDYLFVPLPVIVMVPSSVRFCKVQKAIPSTKHIHSITNPYHVKPTYILFWKHCGSWSAGFKDISRFENIVDPD